MLSSAVKQKIFSPACVSVGAHVMSMLYSVPDSCVMPDLVNPTGDAVLMAVTL